MRSSLRRTDRALVVEQCAFYFVNFTMDTTFGVFLNWVFLEAFSLLAKRFQWTSVMVPGDYGNPIRVRCVRIFPTAR